MATRANPKLRGAILTVGVTIIVGYGAYFGAQLKTEQELKHEVKTYREAPVDEQIALLQKQRDILMTKRNGLARKLQEVEGRLQGALAATSASGDAN